MTLFDSLLISPVTTLGLMSAGLALIALAFLIGKNEGRDAGRKEAPRLTLAYVVREVREQTRDDGTHVLDVTDRELIQ